MRFQLLLAVPARLTIFVYSGNVLSYKKQNWGRRERLVYKLSSLFDLERNGASNISDYIVFIKI